MQLSELTPFSRIQNCQVIHQSQKSWDTNPDQFWERLRLDFNVVAVVDGVDDQRQDELEVRVFVDAAFSPDDRVDRLQVGVLGQEVETGVVLPVLGEKLSTFAVLVHNLATLRQDEN